jgi:hypothetical protein
MPSTIYASPEIVGIKELYFFVSSLLQTELDVYGGSRTLILLSAALFTFVYNPSLVTS